MGNWISKQYSTIKTLYSLASSLSTNQENRSSNPNRGIFEYLFGTDDSTLKASSSQSERLSTVAICIDFRARTRAMLPLNVFRAANGRKDISENHWAQWALHNRPNPNMNAYQFWYAVEYLKHYHGNAYGYIDRVNKRIDLLQDESVTMRYKDGEIFYYVNGQLVSGLNILHFKNFSHSGIIGKSTLEFHAETLGHSVDLRRFARRNLRNNPPAYASSTKDKPVSPTGKEQLKSYFATEMEMYRKDGDMPFLYNGFEIKTMGLKPVDAAYLEQISANKEDIYGIFGCPPGLLGAFKTGVTYNNLEQQNLQYLIYTLSPMLVSDEQELNAKIFTVREQANYFCKFNEKALMRTDLKTQSEWLSSMFKLGAINRNYIRETLDENPVDGGETYFIEGNNMVPLDAAGKPVMPAGAAVKRELEVDLQNILKEAGIQTTLNGKLHYGTGEKV